MSSCRDFPFMMNMKPEINSFPKLLWSWWFILTTETLTKILLSHQTQVWYSEAISGISEPPLLQLQGTQHPLASMGICTHTRQNELTQATHTQSFFKNEYINLLRINTHKCIKNACHVASDSEPLGRDLSIFCHSGWNVCEPCSSLPPLFIAPL